MKSTKTLFLLLILIGSGTLVQAQSTFTEGQINAYFGLGLGSTFSFTGTALPLGGGAEYAFTDRIGGGVDIGFLSTSGLTAIYAGPKASYHFYTEDTWDVYGGLGLYYRHFSIEGISFTLSSGLVPAFHVGGRYYFSDKLGAFAELGNSYGWMKLGVTAIL